MPTKAETQAMLNETRVELDERSRLHAQETEQLRQELDELRQQLATNNNGIVTVDPIKAMRIRMMPEGKFVPSSHPPFEHPPIRKFARSVLTRRSASNMTTKAATRLVSAGSAVYERYAPFYTPAA